MNCQMTEWQAFQQTLWTTGNARIDTLIRQTGARYGVDPYLVYCVIDQESRFRYDCVEPERSPGPDAIDARNGARDTV